MENQKIYVLKQWYTKQFGTRTLAYGAVFGHPDFADGQRIHTSYITGNSQSKDGTKLIETYVGNSYLLTEKREKE